MSKFFFTQFQNVELVVEDGKPSGGSVVQTMVWMTALNQLNQQILLAKFEEDERPLKEEFSWIKLVNLYHSQKFKKHLVWFTYRFPKIIKVLKKHYPDFVYTAIPTWSAFYFCLICKVLGMKHIIRIASDPDVDKSLMPGFSKFHEALINFSYQMADLVLAQNNFQYDTIKSKFPRANVLKVSNPIILDRNFLRTKEHCSGYIAWLANFRYIKNLKLLYNIAVLMPNEQFKIAGEALPPLDDETKLFLQKLNELSNVEFLGLLPRNSVLEFLKNAKYLLNTSRREGFSNTFLESMVVGTPILTTPAVNPDGIIDSHKLGFLYSDEFDLKNILNAVNDSDYLEKSQNCISYVKEYHDHIKLGTKILDILNARP